MSYIGSTPTTQSFIAGTDYFNGNGSTVNFTLSRSVNSVNDIEVIVNNVEQIPSGYSVSGTTLTFSAAPSAGTSNVYVRYLSTTNLSLAIPSGTSATFNTVTATNLTVTNDATINGIKVGEGGGSVANNTAVGASALAANTTGSTNTAIGSQAGTANTTGYNMAALGRAALLNNTTGNDNTATGQAALAFNTTGSNNTAVGSQALYLNTTASNNTAVGYQAGYSNTTGSPNSAFGRLSLYTNTTGTDNTAIGQGALYTGNGSYNTAVGNGSLYALTSGTFNTAIGWDSGSAITTGAKNTIIGRYSGNQDGLDIRTANNYIVLSNGDGNPKAWIGAGNSNDLFRVGTVSTATPDWMHQISYSQTSRFVLGVTNDVSGGNPSGIAIRYPNSGDAASTNFYLYGYNTGGLRFGAKNDGGISNYSANNVNLSDRREKEDFAEAGNYLNKICAIPVQTFRYIDRDADDTALTLGVVAQDVQAVAPELVTESNWAGKDEPERMRLSIYQTDLQYALMKCIQEQQALIVQLQADVAALKAAP